MPLTVSQFVRRLVDAELIARRNLDELVIGLSSPPEDGQQLAKELVRRGTLTKYQAQVAYAGDGDSLVLGNYVILDKIGAGGMGEVYLAEHRRMGRKAALKILPAKVTDNPDAIRRFHREVQAVAKLSHPNIVGAFDAGESKGSHYCVMEYVEGRDLTTTFKQDGQLSEEMAVDCIIQAAVGLEYAHNEKVIHRDIKPANLLLDKNGVLKVLDLGLARFEQDGHDSLQTELTQTGTVMGTVDYMAPEQALNTKHADARSDVYSLGCTLFYLLNGRSVYQGETVIERILAHRDQPIPSLQVLRPEISPAVDAVFQKMIAKKPEDRIQSMRAVAEALQACRITEAATATDGTTAGTDMELRRFLTGIDEPVTQTYVEPISPVEQPTEQPPVETQDIPALGNTFSLGLTKHPKKTARDYLSDRRVQLWGGGFLGVIVFVVLAAAMFGGGGDPDEHTKPEPKPAIIVPQPPSPAVAPFNVLQATAHQAAWAKHLGVPVEDANNMGMKFRLIPPGEFDMGSSAEDVAGLLPHKQPINGLRIRSEVPKCRVRITQPFYLGVHEVTQSQMRQIVGSDSSYFSSEGVGSDRVQGLDTSDFPADTVSGVLAAKFCNGLSRLKKLKPYYLINGEDVVVQGGNGFRLPTEEEWEYACRAGSRTTFSYGDTVEDLWKHAWFKGNSDIRTQSVGSKKPNAFGLFDMHGNVVERCLIRSTDWTEANRLSVRTTGLPADEVFRVFRGGTYHLESGFARSASRTVIFPGTRTGFGFRVARTINSKLGAPPQVIQRGPSGTLPPTPYTQRPKPVRTISAAGKIESAVAARNAPRILAMVGLGEGQTAIVYESHTGKEFGRLELTPWVNNKNQTATAFSANGRVAVFHFQDGTVWIWHIEKPGGPLILRGRNGDAIPAVSSDSRHIALRHDATSIRIIDAATGKESGLLKGVPSGTISMAFSPDGKWLWTGDNTGLNRWNLQAFGKPERILDNNQTFLLSVSDDEALIVAGWRDLRVYSSRSRKVIQMLKPNGDNFVKPVLGRDSAGRSVLAANSSDKNSHFLEIWDVESGTRSMLVPIEHKEGPVPVGFQRNRNGQVQFVFLNRYATEFEIWDIPQQSSGGNVAALGDYALSFDGKDDYVDIPTLKLNNDHSFTLEAWVKIEPEQSHGFGVVLSNKMSQKLGGWVSLYVDPSLRSWGMFNTQKNTAATATFGRLVHIAGVRDGKRTKFFVNGKLVAEEGDSSDSMESGIIVIGAERFFQGTVGKIQYFLHGTISEVRISEIARYKKDFTPAKHFMPDKDALALYHFDEGIGDVLKDSSGNNHHGKIHGATWVSAGGMPIKKHALSFDGKNSYVHIPKLPFKENQPCTIEARVKLARNASDIRVIFATSRAASGPVLYYDRDQGVSSIKDSWNFGFPAPQVTKKNRMDIGSPADDSSSWTHLAGTWDGQEMHFFVNGKLVKSAKILDTSKVESLAAYIGLYRFQKGSPDQVFHGLIDEFRISNSVRYTTDFTPKQRFKTDKDTLALYHFDEGQGDVLKDSSGKNHHGKVYGATWVKEDR